jgi:hypothetical protein
MLENLSLVIIFFEPQNNSSIESVLKEKANLNYGPD